MSPPGSVFSRRRSDVAPVYAARASVASPRVAQRASCTNSVLSVTKKLLSTALSQQSPRRLHTRRQAGCGDCRLVLRGGVVRPAIGVVQQTGRRLPLGQGAPERAGRQDLVQRRARRPTHHPPRAEIQEGSEVEPALVGPAGRHIPRPHAIELPHRKLAAERVRRGGPCGGVAGALVPSCRRHSRSCSGRRASSRATWASGRPLSASSRTAPSLNSRLNCRRFPGIGHLPPPKWRLRSVSTKSGQLQARTSANASAHGTPAAAPIG